MPGAAGASRWRMVLVMTRFSPSVFTLVRTPDRDVNPTTLAQRANAFATAAKECESAVLISHRNDEGMHSFVVLAGGSDSVETAAVSIAQAIGARAERSELPESLAEAGSISRATFRRGSSVSRETMLGTDPTEFSRRMETALHPGDWVAISLREISNREDRRHEAWTDFRLGSGAASHPSRYPDATLFSIYAGSDSSKSAGRLVDMTRSAMHGFDLRVRPERVSLLGGVVGWFASALGAAAAGFAWRHLVDSGTLPSLVADSPAGPLVGTALLGLGVLAFLVGVLRVSGIFPTLWHRVRRGLPDGRVPAPPRRHGRPRPPRAADKDTRTGKKTKAHPGDYPLHRAAFLTAPVVFVGLVAPYAETTASSSASRSRAVPPMVSQRRGPLIGVNNDAAAHIAMSDAHLGVAIVGDAGSGKSGLTRTLFGYACADWAQPTRLPGSTGSRNTLIAFETKGDGVAAYQAWARVTHAPVLVIDLADPNSFAIDLFASTGNVLQRGEAFANDMRYAYGEGAIQDRALPVLSSIFAAAIAIAENPGLTTTMKLTHVREGASALYYANVLIGNLGDALSTALAEEVISQGTGKGSRPASPSVRMAAEAITAYFQDTTPAQRSNHFDSSRNKVKQLASLSSWWERPAKKRLTWSQVLGTDKEGRHRAVIINTGDTPGEVVAEEKLLQNVSSIIFHSLQRAIRVHCGDWFETGRSVTVLSDELSMVAGSSPEVVSWMKDKARSYGVRPIFATQYAEQLPREVQKTFLSFGTLFAFRQTNREVAATVAGQLSAVVGEVTEDEIVHLSKFTAMVRTHIDEDRQSPFTISIPHFESDRAAALSQQGFSTADAEPSAVVTVTPSTVTTDQPAAVAPATWVAPSTDSLYSDEVLTEDLRSW